MPGNWKMPKPLRRLSPEAQDLISICGRSSDLFPNIRPSRFYPVVFRMFYDKTYSYGDSSGLSPDSLFIRPCRRKPISIQNYGIRKKEQGKRKTIYQKVMKSQITERMKNGTSFLELQQSETGPDSQTERQAIETATGIDI